MATDHHSHTGPQPLAKVAAKVVAETRLRRKARMLADRPPRLLVEAIFALAELHGDLQVAERIIDQILAIPDEVLAKLGGLDVPPAPIHVVSK